MAKIKFNLNFGGVPIRTLDELRENFSIEDALDNYHSGALLRWLDSRGYTSECEQISAIASDGARDILKGLLTALNVQASADEIEETLSLFDYLEQRKTFWDEIKAGNYDKVAKKARENKVILGNLAVGETVKFGHYVQTKEDMEMYEKSPIEWLVLARENDHVLLISKKALEYKVYHQYRRETNWEESVLRQWLNNEFMNIAFSADERAAILSVRNSSEKQKATDDYVFLLSADEAIRYFENDQARWCQPTAYVRSKNCGITANGNCWWWLRSPGIENNCNKNVVYEGKVGNLSRVDDAECVRPALWASNLEA